MIYAKGALFWYWKYNIKKRRPKRRDTGGGAEQNQFPGLVFIFWARYFIWGWIGCAELIFDKLKAVERVFDHLGRFLVENPLGFCKGISPKNTSFLNDLHFHFYVSRVIKNDNNTTKMKFWALWDEF